MFQPFHQKALPWLDDLKLVLERYPDGQILKELIQNADDAGAQNVIVLYDKIHHPANTLLAPEMARHQGPALYVYNDAIFGEDDWENIQNPKRSAKLRDPSKIGRFGLGFNSVYHLTDVPSILSGKKIAFLDPQKANGIDEGKVAELSRELLSDHKDQFSPYLIPLFKCTKECFGNQSGFSGTIFRLPLRNQDSELGKIYNEGKLYELFDSFVKDADISLQFLKNVQSLAVFEREHANPVPLFSTNSFVGKVKDFRNCRNQFITRISEKLSSSYFCDIVFETQIYKQGSISKKASQSRSRYLVLNMFEENDISQELRTQKDELSMLPCVGISVPIETDANVDFSEVSHEGRAFCFLPLPESENPGIPVNVHGYFALGDNRRSIKWPDLDAFHDVNALWNRALVREIFPKAYAKFIEYSIQLRLPKGVVYSIWPTVSKLEPGTQSVKHTIWKEGIKQFLALMAKTECLYTELDGGKWMKPEDVWINSERDTVIEKVLLRKSYHVVNLPKHVLEVLEWGAIQIHQVTPKLLCDAIREDGLEWLATDEKLHLLHYILGDVTGDYLDLHNVWLLPLHDGTFTKFASRSPQYVYIQDDSIPCEMLPNFGNRFLSSNFLAEDLRKLREAGIVTQLREIEISDFVSLLKEALPGNWTSPYYEGHIDWQPGHGLQPTWDWLMSFWKWLSKTCFQHDLLLDKFTGIPLIPLEKPGPRTCTKLGRIEGDKYICKQSCGEVLPESVCRFLEELGATILRYTLPIQIQNHPEWTGIALPSTPDNILRILEKYFQSGQPYTFFESSVREYLKDTFAKKHIFTKTEANTVTQLPIFVDEQGNFTSLTDNPRTIPPDYYEVPVDQKRISMKCRCILMRTDSDKVALRLGSDSLRCIDKEEFIINHILPDIKNKHFAVGEITNIVKWILKDYDFREDVVRHLLSLEFVTTTSGLKSPSQLYDPQNEAVQLLFQKRDVFPAGRFAKEPLLDYLRCIGLKNESDISKEELLQIAEGVNGLERIDVTTRKVSEALLAHLNKYPSLLQQCVFHRRKYVSFTEALGSIEWLLCESRPTNYPRYLDWYGRDGACYRPNDVALVSSACIQGSVKAFINMPTICEELSEAFKWSYDDVRLEDVMKHLCNIVTSYQSSTTMTITPGQKRLLEESLEHIFDYLCREFLFSNHRVVDLFNTRMKSLAWVWHGSGFTSPSKIAFKDDSLDLKPFLYTVPPVLELYKDILVRLGVRLEFEISDYVSILETIKQENGNNPLKNDRFIVVNNVLKAITSFKDITSVSNRLLAVDENCVLRSMSELTYNDMSDEDKIDAPDLIYTHRNLSLTKPQSEKLGIVSLRQRRLNRSSTSHGFETEFGQKEELTTRLRGILKNSPDKAEVLKELLQNADDAEATEMHVVYDPRQQSTDGIVGSKWGPMHSAPAICVYNNKTFTNTDIEGIKKVGIGGKISDPTKAGHFGIGFNVVYHLTDCPTFVTGSKKLCIFDPHVKYVPGATFDKPGKKYELQGTDGCLAIYPNMVKGYLGEYPEINLETGTVFRFPLRSSSMGSEISNHCYTDDDDVLPLLNRFQEVAKDSLLFLKHVRKISISEIDKANGKLKCRYSVTSEVDDPNKTRKELDDCLKRYTNNSIHQMPQVNSVFFLKLEDTLGNKETWIISECLGVDDIAEEEFQDGKNFMSKRSLPIGAVAALMHEDPGKRSDVGNPYRRSYKAFSLLPLEVNTNLPVHVNGSFMLDQTRKHLLEIQSNDNRMSWNCLLLTKVIPPAYASLIQCAGKHLLKPMLGKDFKRNIKVFNDIFPSILGQFSKTWKVLAKATLSYIGTNKVKVLPVVWSYGETQDLPKVEWYHPTAAESNAFFDNLPREYKDGEELPSELRQFLNTTEFNLLSSSPSLCNEFRESKVAAEFVLPSHVMNHLSRVAAFDNGFRCPVSETVFKTSETLKSVVGYCLKGDKEVTKAMKKEEIEEIHTLNQERLMTLAKKIERCAQSEGIANDFEFLSEVSKVLVAQMKTNASFRCTNFLRNMANIRFIPKVPIKIELQRIHVPYGESGYDSIGPFVPYVESVPDSYKELAWSTAWILPDWAISHLIMGELSESFKESLNISLNNIIVKVLCHMQNVSQNWEVETSRRHEGNDAELESKRKTMSQLIKKMFEFLKEHWRKHNRTIVRYLKDTPMCPVDDYPILVRACHLALYLNGTEGTEEKSLQPYLYKIPTEWMQYFDMLCSLGAQEKVDFDQLAGVLKRIKERHGNGKITNSRDKESIYAAIRCLFQLLKETNAQRPITVTELYLPTITDQMRRSTELYYIDVNEMKNMDLETTKLDIVIPLSQCVSGFNANEEKIIMLLPDNFRPQDLRETMSEKICNQNEECPRGTECPFLLRVKHMISSQEIQIVLLRLIQHQLDTAPTGHHKENISVLLNFHNVKCMPEVKTGLFDRNGKLVLPRRKSRKVFLTREENNESLLCLEHQESDLPITFLHFIELARQIDFLCKLGLDNDHLSHLREVVACSSVGDMNYVLTDLDIPEYDKEPGTMVPADIRHLLDDDIPSIFYAGDLAVVKSPIPDDLERSIDQARDINETCLHSTNSKFSYRYCRIVNKFKSHNEDIHPLGCTYKIDVGESDHITVGEIWLYGFRRPVQQSAIQRYKPGIEALQKRREASERLIRRQVKAASLLASNDKLECIRRLCRMWHPERNKTIDPEGHVFSFLTSQIKEHIDDVTESSISQFYHKWSSEIEALNEVKEQSTASIPYTMLRRTPDLDKAYLWFSQAEEDYQEAVDNYPPNRIDSEKSLAWLAFMLQQVTEKALKAVCFSIDGVHVASHDLISLEHRVRENFLSEKLGIAVRALVGLNCDAMRSRYPEDGTHRTTKEIYQGFDAEGGLKHCRIVLDEVRTILEFGV